jgi:hypothetical protein
MLTYVVNILKCVYRNVYFKNAYLKICMRIFKIKNVLSLVYS